MIIMYSKCYEKPEGSIDTALVYIVYNTAQIKKKNKIPVKELTA